MATPSPSNSAGSSTSTPSSGLTINTAITTPPLLQGPLPKGFSLTPRTQAWYDQIHGNSSSFGNNNANQAPMHMATSMPNGMAAAQNNGLGLTYGNGIAAPQANNTVKNFNGNANNTVAEGPGKDFYTFLAKMKANPADHITMVNQQEIINSASTINYNAGMAASQEDMAITGFDDRMDTSMGAMSYINNNGSHFVNHNEFSTMSYDNGINTNSAGTVINPALVSQENSVQDCSSINTFAPGIGSNMFETSEAVLDRPLSPLDFSAWDDFINMEPTGGILTLPPAGNYESSGTATVDNDMTSAGTVGAPTSSATVSPTAIANLSLAPINTTSPATSTTASPEANITPSAAAAANTTHATTATEDAGQTQDTTARKQIFGLFQISRTDGTTISLEFTTDPGATGMIESLNNLVQDARCGGLRDGGILFVLQEYVRMYKNGECF